MSETKTILSAIEDEESGNDRYQVLLPDFYGPMDLLLTLIEQEDLEITEISLAKVTDQYIGYINALKHITPDTLTEFLVVAAKLIFIKSQVLLPKPPPSLIEDEEDSTDDLVQQLRDYKRFKQLAAELDEIQDTNRRSFVRVAPLPKIEPKLNLGDVDLAALLQAVRRALAVKPEPAEVNTVISREVITIGKQINVIRHKLATSNRLKFNDVLTGARSRVEVIVTLLAVLELVKRRVVDVEQLEDFGEIDIIKKEVESLSEDDWVALGEMSDLS